MDDKTSNKALWITEGGAKVARMTDDVTCPVLDRPERYEYAPQVQYQHVLEIVWSEMMVFLIFHDVKGYMRHELVITLLRLVMFDVIVKDRQQ